MTQNGNGKQDSRESARDEFSLERRLSRRKALGTAAKVGAAVVATAVVAGGGAYYAGTLSAPSAPSAGATATTTITAPGTTTTQTVTQTASGGGGGGGGLSGTITIGGLEGLSTWDSAVNAKYSVTQAVKDVNGWLESNNAAFKFDYRVEDTANSAPTCLQKLQLLQAQGITHFIGPDTSGELSAILDYINSNHLICMSFSTADALAVPGKYGFRCSLKNKYEAGAFLDIAKQFGYKFIGEMNNQQAGDQGIADTVVAGAKQLGMETYAVSYPPNETEFSSIVALLAQNVKAAIAKYGADKVCVHYDETTSSAATVLKVTDGYPELQSVLWWGSDGTAQLDTVNKEAGPEAAKVHLLSDTYSVTPTAYTKQVAATLTQAAGRDVGIWGYLAYDELWLLAYTMMLQNSADPTVTFKNLIPVSTHFYGTTGWFQYDDVGDRAYGDEEFWGYRQNASGGYEYYDAGGWDKTTGQITWTNNTPPHVG